MTEHGAHGATPVMDSSWSTNSESGSSEPGRVGVSPRSRLQVGKVGTLRAQGVLCTLIPFEPHGPLR